MPSFDIVSEVDQHELTNAVDQAEIVAQSLNAASRRRLIGGTDSRYADGHLMFMRGAVLFAARLDPETLSVGTPVAVNPDRGLARHARRNGWEIIACDSRRPFRRIAARVGQRA